MPTTRYDAEEIREKLLAAARLQMPDGTPEELEILSREIFNAFVKRMAADYKAKRKARAAARKA
jgi:hypothetical protein